MDNSAWCWPVHSVSRLSCVIEIPSATRSLFLPAIALLPSLLHTVMWPLFLFTYIYFFYYNTFFFFVICIFLFLLSQSETLGPQPFGMGRSRLDNDFLIALLSISVSKVELVKAPHSARRPSPAASRSTSRAVCSLWRMCTGAEDCDATPPPTHAPSRDERGGGECPRAKR